MSGAWFCQRSISGVETQDNFNRTNFVNEEVCTLAKLYPQTNLEAEKFSKQSNAPSSESKAF
jgi:hypothetical protein